MKTISPLAIAVTGMLLLAETSVLADELSWEGRVGAGRSDNIGRVETDAVDETVAIAGLILDYRYESRGVEFDVAGDLEDRNYVDDTFDNDTFGFVTANLQLNLLQEALTWAVENRFGHTQTNPFAPETPANRERVNSIATGPDALLRLGSSTAVRVSARASRNTFSESDADNDSVRGLVSLQRALSARRSLSLNVTGNRIEFDDDFNEDFDTRGAFFGLVSENSRGSVNLNLGYNELERAGVTEDGRFIDVSIVRRLSDRTEFEFGYNEELTYASGVLSSGLDSVTNFSAETQRIAGVADPLEIREGRLGLSYERESGRLQLLLSGRDEAFLVENDLDRDTFDVRLDGERRFAATWSLGFDAVARRTDFDARSRQDDDLIAGVRLRVDFSETLSAELRVERFDRDSDEPGASFVDNSAFLTFRLGSR